jgi:CXXX repeat peptide maturase
MDKVKSIWLLLSPDAVPCCNEPCQPANVGDELMPLDMFAKIVQLVKTNSWFCTVLGSRSRIPKAYQKLCNEIEARIILPANYKGAIFSKRTTLVFESDQMELMTSYPSVSQAILRMHREHLPHQSEKILFMLEHFSDISIRHPELLSYREQDMTTYRDQLFEVGQRLLDKKKMWLSYCVDRLTDSFKLNVANECGAGIESLAVGPTGELYLCPAAAKDGGISCGHILGGLKIPNRHLLTREYSVPCGKCNALHCSRCIFLNKRSTFEFCVPPKNVCRIAHLELEMQAWFAREAIKKNLWSESYNVPAPPVVYDPYELVKVEEEPPAVQSWRRLVKFDGHVENLQPAMMLDIIHGLQGWCQALTACVESGYIPSVELIERDKLASIRRRTIEQYRDMVFKKGCPTVRQIELLMCSMIQKGRIPSRTRKE